MKQFQTYGKVAKNSESPSPNFSSCLHIPHRLSFTFSFPEHIDFFFQTRCLITAKHSSVHLPKVRTLSYITTIHPPSEDCVSAHYHQTMNWWSHSDISNCLLFLFCSKFYPGIHIVFSCHIFDVFFNLQHFLILSSPLSCLMTTQVLKYMIFSFLMLNFNVDMFDVSSVGHVCLPAVCLSPICGLSFHFLTWSCWMKKGFSSIEVQFVSF